MVTENETFLNIPSALDSRAVLAPLPPNEAKDICESRSPRPTLFTEIKKQKQHYFNLENDQEA